MWIRGVHVSPCKLHSTITLRVALFSHSAVLKAKPIRPTPKGEVIAHFPQKNETHYLKENDRTIESRWKQYVNDLSASAVPKRLGGRDFGSQVRHRPKFRGAERDNRPDKRV